MKKIPCPPYRVRLNIPFAALSAILLFCLIVSAPVAGSKDIAITPTQIDIVTAQKIPLEDMVRNYNLTNSTAVNESNRTSPPISLSCLFPLGLNETRTILVTNNQDEALTDVNITALDLITTDNQFTITPDNIRANYSARNTTIAPHGFLSIPVTFFLANTHSGEYKGSLQITSNTTADSLPVDIKIKDSWVFPFFVLVIVTYFSVIVARYISSGKQRDKVRILVGRIEKRFLTDDILNSEGEETQFTGIIRDIIRNAIEDTRLSLILGDAEDIKAKYQELNRVWNLWDLSGFRLDWQSCIVCTRRILSNPNHTGEDVNDVKGYWLAAAKKVMDPKQDSAAPHPTIELKKNLTVLSKELENRILKGTGAKPRWFCFDEAITRQMKNFSLGSLFFSLIGLLFWILIILVWIPPFTGLFQEIALILELCVAIIIICAIAHKAIRRSISNALAEAWPRFWLAVYAGVTGVFLPSMFLIFMGFTELYSKQPTFGANGAADYIGLVLWAFGTGPTAQKFTELVQGYQGIQQFTENFGKAKTTLSTPTDEEKKP